MSVKQRTSVYELEQKIIIENPGGRVCRINPGQSGWKEEQVFTSEDFPEKITGVLLKEASKKVGKPVYCLEGSKQKLILQGWYGYKYGQCIMDRICNELLTISGIYFARSVQKSDLEGVCQIGEGNCWLASTCKKDYGYGLYKVCKGEINDCTLFDSDGLEEDGEYNILPLIVVNIEGIY